MPGFVRQPVGIVLVRRKAGPAARTHREQLADQQPADPVGWFVPRMCLILRWVLVSSEPYCTLSMSAGPPRMAKGLRFEASHRRRRLPWRRSGTDLRHIRPARIRPMDRRRDRDRLTDCRERPASTAGGSDFDVDRAMGRHQTDFMTRYGEVSARPALAGRC